MASLDATVSADLGVPDLATHEEVRARNLAWRTFLIAFGQTLVKGNQVVAGIVLANLLGENRWSRLAILLSFYLTGATLGTLNLQQGAVFFISRTGVAQGRRVIGHIVAMLSAMGIITSLIMVLFVGRFIGAEQLELRGLVPYIALAVLFELPAAAAGPGLIAVERVVAAAAWDSTHALIQLAGLIIPPTLGFGVKGAVIGLALAGAIRFVAFVVLFFSVFSGPVRPFDPRLAREIFRFGLPLGLSLGTSVMNRNVDKWLVAQFRPTQVGSYSLAANEVPIIAVLPYAVGTALATRMMGAFRDGKRELARQYWLAQTGAMSLYVVPISVGLVVVAPALFSVVLKTEFGDGVWPFRIFTILLAHRVAEYGLVLRAADRNAEMLRISVGLLAGNIALGLVLAWLFGGVGAASATMIATLVSWYRVLRVIADIFSVPMKDAFAWRVWLSSLGWSIVAGTAGMLIADAGGIDTGWERLVLQSVVIIGVYVVGVRVLGITKLVPRLPHADVS